MRKLKPESLSKTYLFYLLFWGCTFMGFAQSDNSYLFRTLSPEGGFTYGGIYKILPTSKGPVWMWMENNIQQFDGYRYKDYTAFFRQIDPTLEWDFHHVILDEEECLHVATNNGLYRYDAEYCSLQLLFPFKINSFIKDTHSNFWLVKENLLYTVVCREDTLKPVLYKGNHVRHISRYAVKGDRIFMATRYNRIYSFDYTDPDSLSLFHMFPGEYLISDIKVTERDLWVLVNRVGVFRISFITGEVEHIINDLPFLQDRRIHLRSIHIDKSENIWIATQQGVYVVNIHTGEFQHYTYSKNDALGLVNNSVWHITEDKHRNLWLGTFSGGISYVNPDERKWFKSYTTHESELNHNVISCFSENERFIWVGTEGGGLNRIDKESGIFKHYLHEPGFAGSLSVNNIKSIVSSRAGNLWIALYRGGLNYYNEQLDRFISYNDIGRGDRQIYGRDLRKIIPSHRGGIWIAYQLGQPVVSYFSATENRFRHIKLEEEVFSYVYDICTDENDNLWVVTSRNLYRVNGLTYEVNKILPDSLPFLHARAICRDEQGCIWIGTMGEGLVQYDPEAKQFSLLDSFPGKEDTGIVSLCTDDDDCLWMGTDEGIYRYDPRTERWMNFNKSDGLPGNIYSPLSCFKGWDGTIYMGSTSGFVAITPRNLWIDTYQPEVFISDFYIDNNSSFSVLANQRIDKRETAIWLDHKQANFGFRLSTDNYMAPEKNIFRYRLRGHSEQWTTVRGTQPEIFYPKVPPGTYSFEVLVSNNSGVWNETPFTLTIKRLPAPWLSWKAYCLYSLLILGILGIINYYYRKGQKLKMQIYLDQLDKEKNEEIHQSQLRFFTNISHDFRTPLSLILASLESIKEEGINDYFYSILYNNSQRLLNLTNELMDFRKVENGKIKLKISSFTVNHQIIDISRDFMEYARKKSITFRQNLDPSLSLPVQADRSVVEKILMNLLNNAFKYTPEGGTVTIESYVDESDFTSGYAYRFQVGKNIRGHEKFIIVIRDTGIGITESSIRQVFERFYKVESANQDAHLGTGIGLALVKSLVLLHQGNITIYSEREKGTDMVVVLPGDLPLSEESESVEENENKFVTVYSQKYHLLAEKEAEQYMVAKRRILIVEDNEDLRNLLVNFLSSSYEVKSACNGQEGADIVSDMDIDLIISDIMMPVKDGITFCKEIKGNIETSHITFILLTGKTGVESRLEGADSGADIYFEKPVDLNLLLLTLHNAFVHRQKIRDYYARNYYADSSELAVNEQDSAFLKQLIEVIDHNMKEPTIDVNYIAAELSMSRSKLYTKVKTLTGKSIVEFILNHRLRKAARLIIEEDLTMYQVMEAIGLKSQSYFIRVFKKEFGDTPTTFATKNKRKARNRIRE